jgi:hypothetical protein
MNERRIEVTRESTKKQRAITLRDKALKLVRSKGKLSPLLTGKTVLFKTLTFQSGYIEIHYRSPFEPIHDAFVMPYGLDVYWAKRVLVVEWDDAGEVHVVGFRPGEWEGKLTAFAAAL